jgi:hypothetical protein
MRRDPRALLFMYFGKGELSSDRDLCEDRMARIQGQAQSMHLLPDANTRRGRIRDRALLGPFEPPPFAALFLLDCDARTMIPNDVRG